MMMLRGAPLVTQVFQVVSYRFTVITHQLDMHDVHRCRLLGISEHEYLLPDQVEKVQREEGGSPEVKSYFCFSRSSKAQEVTCKCIHNSEGQLPTPKAVVASKKCENPN